MSVAQPQAAVLVVGDCMLDRYWDGRVERISPEAPVPVLHMRAESNRAGGAGNVAANARDLGAAVELLGVVGNDDAGRAFRKLVEAAGIVDRLVVSANAVTTMKLRVVSQKHQLLRVDFEEPVHASVAASVGEQFARVMARCDCVVFSDYAKGALGGVSEMIRLSKAAGKVVVVDPKGADFRKYAGADVITPNQGELAQITGHWHDEEDLSRRAFALRRELSIDSLLLTRSERGMSLFTQVEGVERRFDLPAEAREVFDVTGAGDTVIAALAVMLGEGRALLDAVQAANRAAALVVGKFGTSSVKRAELSDMPAMSAGASRD